MVINLYSFLKAKSYLGPLSKVSNSGMSYYYLGIRNGFIVLNLMESWIRLKLAVSFVADSVLNYSLLGFIIKSYYRSLVLPLSNVRDEREAFCGFFYCSPFVVLTYKPGVLTNFINVINNLVRVRTSEKFLFFPQIVCLASGRSVFTSLSNEILRVRIPSISISDTSSSGLDISVYPVPVSLSYGSVKLCVSSMFGALKVSFFRHAFDFSKRLRVCLDKYLEYLLYGRRRKRIYPFLLNRFNLRLVLNMYFFFLWYKYYLMLFGIFSKRYFESMFCFIKRYSSNNFLGLDGNFFLDVLNRRDIYCSLFVCKEELLFRRFRRINRYLEEDYFHWVWYSYFCFVLRQFSYFNIYKVNLFEVEKGVAGKSVRLVLLRLYVMLLLESFFL